MIYKLNLHDQVCIKPTAAGLAILQKLNEEPLVRTTQPAISTTEPRRFNGDTSKKKLTIDIDEDGYTQMSLSWMLWLNHECRLFDAFDTDSILIELGDAV